MKTKKIPMRTCLISNEKLPKSELIRIVKTPDDRVIVDETMKANGHGAYIKRDLNVIDKLQKSKRLNSLFSMEVDNSIYDELKKIIEK